LILPSAHAAALLVATVATFYLYTRSWIRMELVSLLLLLGLLVLFYWFPFAGSGARYTDVDVFHAFGHPALIAICCLMVMGRGLVATGAIEPAVRWLARVWDFNRGLGLLLTLLVAGLASAFVNDTPVLVLMLPLLLGLAKRTRYPASRTLLPVNFAILAGGTLTSIGTSTNILVLNIASDLGMKPVGVFDFTGIALVGFAVALAYLWLVAPHLLPAVPAASEPARRQFDARILVSAADGRLVGRKPAELSQILGRPLPASILIRGGVEMPVAEAEALTVGDALLVRDSPEGLRELATTFAVDLFDKQGAGRFAEADSSGADVHLAELVLGNGAELNGRTLRQTRFASTHQVVVVGISRGTEDLFHATGEIADETLATGDVLLVQGSSDRIERLRNLAGLMLLDTSMTLPRSPKARIALAIMVGVIVIASAKLLPLHVAAFLGVVLMLVAGCVRLEGVGRALSLEVVLLVAASLALGQALVTTGAATWVATGVVAIVNPLPPALQLASFMTFAALLTNFVSNSAAAAVGTPIAVATAIQLALPLEPFVLAILFGANLSYATPMAYQTNLMVMRAGGYRFADFVRAGLPLVVLMLITLSILLTRRYGL
jgi:di/tricarboxylate transporter